MRPGRFKGQKRSDKHFIAPDGEVWDSEYEYRVYLGFLDAGARVRRTVKGSSDTFDYPRPIRSAQCLGCGSSTVVQRCTYTPDLLVAFSGPAYWVEAKGYFQQQKRAAFRDFAASEAGRRADVRMVLQSDHKVGKGTVITYARKYLKTTRVTLWKGKKGDVFIVPEDWR